MNGAHDLGGADGFGPVVREEREPVFHASWERTVFAMMLATMGQGVYNLDEVRHAIERMPPAEYLSTTYYEHWLAGLERLLVEKGVVGAEDLAARRRRMKKKPAPAPTSTNPALVAGLGQGVRAGAPTARAARTPRFDAGAAVRVRQMHPAGHTRCPRYVRGAPGIIARVHGGFVFPDRNAHGGGEAPEPLYSVRFAARDLWGDDAEGSVYVDLWESYLEPR
jgi:nitrile hydratase subunit beta